MRRSAPAALRNRDPILAVLRGVVRDGARVLEVACGTGEHAEHFARGMPGVTWLPTDLAPQENADDAPPNLRAPMILDASAPSWELGEAFDVVYCANMVHIAPWAAAEGLFRNAARVLLPGGVLFLYGPYRMRGAFTAPSNEAFDLSLRATDPAWGVRDLDDLEKLGAEHGFVLERVEPMPANNHCLVFRRAETPPKHRAP